MSKRLGGIIGCKDKTSSWHLNGFPDGNNVFCFSHVAYLLPTRKKYITRWPIPLACGLLLYFLCPRILPRMTSSCHGGAVWCRGNAAPMEFRNAFRLYGVPQRFLSSWRSATLFVFVESRNAFRLGGALQRFSSLGLGDRGLPLLFS